MEALAVKYRPSTFEDVVSQSAIIRILKKQIENKQFKNCYLFCGASGCGKTTVARIFANQINGGVGNPIEIDAASNNGVENVRHLIKTASERSLDSEYKIIIIDECHALTTQAWQAFLKCIEEPPAYTIFIFCTTDPQKVPPTIINRTMRFNFSRITDDKIRERLQFICKKENYTNYADACDYISRISNGGMRDAIACLNKCADYNTDLSINHVLEAIGDFSYETLFNFVNSCIDGNENAVLTLLDKIFKDGSDLSLFVNNLFRFVMDVMKYVIYSDLSITTLPISYEENIKQLINFDNAKDYYFYLVNKIFKLRSELKNDPDIKALIEVYSIQICRCI